MLRVLSFRVEFVNFWQGFPVIWSTVYKWLNLEFSVKAQFCLVKAILRSTIKLYSFLPQPKLEKIGDYAAKSEKRQVAKPVEILIDKLLQQKCFEEEGNFFFCLF